MYGFSQGDTKIDTGGPGSKVTVMKQVRTKERTDVAGFSLDT